MTRLKRQTGEGKIRSRSGTEAKQVFREETGSARDSRELRKIRVKGGNLKKQENTSWPFRSLEVLG